MTDDLFLSISVVHIHSFESGDMQAWQHWGRCWTNTQTHE